MAKPRPREQTYEFTDKPSYREWLIETVRAALPDGLELAASNYAHSTASSYWLIKGYDDHDQVFWLTLRIATHRLWLQNAHQIEVLWEEPGTFGDLFNAVSNSLQPVAVQNAKFTLSSNDIAVLNLLIALEHHKLIWFIRMVPDIAKAHKDKLFDLKSDFLDCQLLLGDRNNANNLLLPVDVPAFQHQLATYFGENLLFSQFTKHSLLKLLPTNQWIQPMLDEQGNDGEWENEIRNAYGDDFVELCQRELKHQAKVYKKSVGH